MKKQNNLGKTIASLRIKKEWTQADLANKLNVSEEAVSKWEIGKELPDDVLLSQLSEIFNVSIEYLLTGTLVDGAPSGPISLFDYGVSNLGYVIMGVNDKTLTKAVIPDGVCCIDHSAFDCCESLTSVTIPDSVIFIGNFVFSACISLETIYIPDSVEGIGFAALFGCSSLTSITVDDNNPNYSSIDGNLYDKDGTELIQYAIGKTNTSFVIPDDVTYIAHFAFFGCDYLTSIIVHDNVTFIGDRAFCGCPALTSIIIDDNNPNYSSIDGNLYNKDGTELIQYAVGKTDTSFVIPDSVTSIGKWAFSFCECLTSVIIPDSVVSIGDDIFGTCESLKFIFYKGIASEWNSISFENKSSNPTYCGDVDVYFYSETEPTEKNVYWHYVDGVPTVW